MTEAEARALFLLAGFKVEKMWQLQNGYGGGILQSLAEEVPHIHVYRGGETLLEARAFDFLRAARAAALSPWWLVKTQFGLIEIGWRKRVINIDWSETGIEVEELTKDETTKEKTYVHAWTMAKALEYLQDLLKAMEKGGKWRVGELLDEPETVTIGEAKADALKTSVIDCDEHLMAIIVIGNTTRQEDADERAAAIVKAMNRERVK